MGEKCLPRPPADMSWVDVGGVGLGYTGRVEIQWVRSPGCPWFSSSRYEAVGDPSQKGFESAFAPTVQVTQVGVVRFPWSR